MNEIEKTLRYKLKLSEQECDLLRKRIAELEAAQQWHPASAPPPQDQDGWPKYSKRVEMLTEACYSYHYNEWRVIVGEKGWRELPPMPGKESR